MAGGVMRCVLCGAGLERLLAASGEFYKCSSRTCVNQRQYVTPGGAVAYRRPAGGLRNPVLFMGRPSPFVEMAASPEGCLVPFGR